MLLVNVYNFKPLYRKYNCLPKKTSGVGYKWSINNFTIFYNKHLQTNNYVSSIKKK